MVEELKVKNAEVAKENLDEMLELLEPDLMIAKKVKDAEEKQTKELKEFENAKETVKQALRNQNIAK